MEIPNIDYVQTPRRWLRLLVAVANLVFACVWLYVLARHGVTLWAFAMDLWEAPYSRPLDIMLWMTKALVLALAIFGGGIGVLYCVTALMTRTYENLGHCAGPTIEK